MKIFKLLAIAFVAMLSFSSCEKECDHDFIMVDYSNDIVGTWTLIESDHAAAYIFNADGTLSTTGLDGEEYWEDVKGTYSVVNNKITIKFESGRIINGSFDIIPGQTISIVGEKGRHTYQYCKEDLSEEIVGMWVCTQSTAIENEMAINTYQEDGKALFTGITLETNGYMANLESTYKVIGDLLIQKYYINEDEPQYLTFRLNYSPNATTMGDVLTITSIMTIGDQVVESYSSMLRIKQELNLEGKKYDYIRTYISNVKGENQDIPFFNTTINFANLDNAMFDKFLKATLFAVQFPDANTIEYSFLMGEQLTPMQAPIEVEGNKMTIKMSELNDVYRDIDIYTFQDQDDSQMHMYMPTASFENFLGNMQVNLMDAQGQLDITDKAAVEAIFSMVENAIQSINISFVMTKSSTTKAL